MVVLMHMKGTPKTMQENPQYKNVVDDIITFFRDGIEFCRKSGISDNQIILDPGIGFGKRLEHNLKILSHLDKFKDLGYPVLIGTSRKSFINDIHPSEAIERLPGTLASTAYGINANVDIIRVHDPKENIQFIKTFKAIKESF